MQKRKQFLLFPLLRNQGKPVIYNNNIQYTYSKHGLSDVEQFEVLYNYSYGKGMTAEKKAIPPVSSSNKAK